MMKNILIVMVMALIWNVGSSSKWVVRGGEASSGLEVQPLENTGCFDDIKNVPGCYEDLTTSAQLKKIWLTSPCCDAINRLNETCSNVVFSTPPFNDPGFGFEVKDVCSNQI